MVGRSPSKTKMVTYLKCYVIVPVFCDTSYLPTDYHMTAWNCNNFLIMTTAKLLSLDE